jgi:hypothetical protein
MSDTPSELLEKWRPEELRRLDNEEFFKLEALLKHYPGHGIRMNERRERRDEYDYWREVRRQLLMLRDYNRQLRENPVPRPVAPSRTWPNPLAPAPQTSEMSGAPSSDEPLSDRAQCVLVAMLELRAIDSDSRKSTEEITAKALGSQADANPLKNVMSELNTRRLIDSKTGRGGGCWLTDKGRVRAAKLGNQ